MEDVFDTYLSGGYLHSQIEDGNLDDCDFEDEELIRRPHNLADPSDVESRCYEILRSMTEPERYEAYRRYWDD